MYFGLIPAMGTEPVTAGESWQNTIENGAIEKSVYSWL